MSPRDFGDRLWEYEFRHGTEPPPPRLTAIEVWLLSTFALLIVTLVAIVLWIAFFGGGA